jgi:hypothetical protein
MLTYHPRFGFDLAAESVGTIQLVVQMSLNNTSNVLQVLAKTHRALVCC